MEILVKDADEGRTIGDDKVGEWVESIGTPREIEPPRCKDRIAPAQSPRKK